jgi:hypothetical protein
VFDFYKKSTTLFSMNKENINLVASHVDEVFAVWTNTDLTEGRGAEYVRDLCRYEATAKRLAKKNYVMGSDCNISKIKIYLIGNRWYGPSTYINHGTDADVAEENKLKKEREAKMLREKIFDKARALGLTEDEIATLRT